MKMSSDAVFRAPTTNNADEILVILHFLGQISLDIPRELSSSRRFTRDVKHCLISLGK